MLDQDGNILLDVPDDGNGLRPEVLRGDLRQILLNALPADTVRWGHKVVQVHALGGGRHEVAFSNGAKVATALLVGADGAWSRVRPLLSEARPIYAGTSFIETYLFDCDARHQASAQAVGGGAMYALTPGKGVIVHREANAVLHTYVALSKPEEWIAGIDFSSTTAAARIAQEFDGWAPQLTALITAGETAPVPRPIHALPIGHRWERVPGVTLLGDAAHLNPPDGEGANLAMFDGAELAKAIAAHPGQIEAALAAYERELFPRSASAAVEAHQTFELCFGDDAPHSLIDMFSSSHAIE